MTRVRRERLKRIGWLDEAQVALGWGVILILAALLGTIYLRQTSHIAAVGRRVQQLQYDLNTLKRENAALEQQIAEAQAIDRLHEEIKKLGFISPRPEDIEYIVVPNYPVAEEAPEPHPTNPPSEAPAVPETMREALWLTLQSSISNLIRGEAGEP
ncbi:MAG: hypothetical protein ACE5E7_00865 [Anaerolineae bacterium]